VLSSLSNDFIQLTKTGDILSKCISAIATLKTASTSDASKKTFSFSEIRTSVRELFSSIRSSMTSGNIHTVGMSLLRMLSSNVKDVTGKVEQLTKFSTKMTKFSDRVTSSLTKIQETATSFNGEEFSSSTILLISEDGSGFTDKDGKELFVQKSEALLVSNLQVLAQNADAVEKVISVLAVQSEQEDKEDVEENNENSKEGKNGKKGVKFGKFLKTIKKFSILLKEIKEETFYSLKFQSLALSIVEMFSQGLRQGTSMQYEQLSKQQEIFTTFSSKLNMEINRVVIDYRSVTGFMDFTIKNVEVETINEEGLGIFGKSGTSFAISRSFGYLTDNVFNIKKSGAAISVLKTILADDSEGSEETAMSSSRYMEMLGELINIISFNVFDGRIQGKTIEIYEAKMKTTVQALSDDEKTSVQSYVKTVEKAEKIIESANTEILKIYKLITGKEFTEDEAKEIPTMTDKGELTETKISTKMSVVDLDKEYQKVVKSQEIVFGMQSSIFAIIKQISRSSFSSNGASVEFSEVKNKIKETFSLLEQNMVSEKLEKFGKDMEFFTTANVVGYKSSDISDMFRHYKKLSEHAMMMTKQMVMYAQNMSPYRVKKAIITIMEVEDGVPKIKEAFKKVKDTDQSLPEITGLVGAFNYFTNTLINSNNYKHCLAAIMINAINKNKLVCDDEQYISLEKTSVRMEDYEDQIPRIKTKLMDIYFDLTNEKFDESSVTLVNVFKDDGTFEEGKGTDCKT